MPCFHPLTAWRNREGGITFEARYGVGFSMKLACSQCQGCRVDRSRQWAVRCVHEAQMHKDNSFLTLTYDPEHIPEGLTLVKKDFQDFMKRLRKAVPIGPRQCASQFLRYYHCGEYGEERGRPHYHALLFGFDFPDKKLFRVVRGNKYFTSDCLTELWGKGFSTVCAVTFQSAAYVARYVMKKITGPGSERFYQVVDQETGEVFDRIPEYTTMSLKPGIGSTWFAAYQGDVFPGDFVVLQGKKYKTPRFYDRLYERALGEQALEMVKSSRRKHARESASEQTPERLAVREAVFNSKVKLLKRDTLK